MYTKPKLSKFETTYATPAVKQKRKGKQDPKHRDWRNPNDPISALDGYAITSDYDETIWLQHMALRILQEMVCGIFVQLLISVMASTLIHRSYNK